MGLPTRLIRSWTPGLGLVLGSSGCCPERSLPHSFLQGQVCWRLVPTQRRLTERGLPLPLARPPLPVSGVLLSLDSGSQWILAPLDQVHTAPSRCRHRLEQGHIVVRPGEGLSYLDRASSWGAAWGFVLVPEAVEYAGILEVLGPCLSARYGWYSPGPQRD